MRCSFKKSQVRTDATTLRVDTQPQRDPGYTNMHLGFFPPPLTWGHFFKSCF